MFREITARYAGLILLCVCTSGNAADGPQVNKIPVQPTDAFAFRTALTEQGVAARWEGDPSALASAELQNAFPGIRFFYTFKPRPQPPGAPMPELIAAYKQAMEAYEKNSLRITIGLNDRGFATAFRTPEDFNAGLRPVTSDETAKTAAAAILSLMDADQVGPGPVPAQDVVVSKTDNGWSCSVAQPQGIKGVVTFGRDGRCTSAVKGLNYMVPRPS